MSARRKCVGWVTTNGYMKTGERRTTAGDGRNRLHTQTHAGYGEMATWGCWFPLVAKDTTDDNFINPVSPLPPSLSQSPSFSWSFYR